MKANELMIGDWVYDTILCGNTKVIEVTSNKVRCDIHEQCYPDSGFNPIPLTVEILEKNGWKHEFDKTDYMVKYDLKKEGKNCWMMWSIKEHNLDVQRQDENLDMYNLKVSRVVIPCDFVHQLQHALRLCKIDKTIEL